VSQFQQVVTTVVAVGLAIVAGHGGVSAGPGRRPMIDASGLPPFSVINEIKRLLPPYLLQFNCVFKSFMNITFRQHRKNLYIPRGVAIGC